MTNYISLAMRLTIRTLILGVLLLIATSAYTYTVSIPEKVSKLPAEEQAEWINKELEDAHELQKKVAKERYERRMKGKQQVSMDMAAEAQKRRRIIKSARAAMRKREREATARYHIAYLVILIIIIGGVTFYVFRRRQIYSPRRTIEIPVPRRTVPRRPKRKRIS